MITQQYQEELNIWFYTWFKLGHSSTIEQFLSTIIERIILNPYPLLEKTIKDSGYSLMLSSAFDTKEISQEIDEYLCCVMFQIYLRQIHRSSDHIHLHHLLKDKKHLQIFQLLTNISLPDGSFLENIERIILSNIDLQRGPDRMQIHLAIELNLFKIFANNDYPRLINEMIQCLNIVLLLHDPHRAFSNLFERLIEDLQSYSLTIGETRVINLLCQLINGLDMSHQQIQPLKHSNILLKCLQLEMNNPRLIHFISHYLSGEYRREFLDLICQTVTDDVAILKILIKEIQKDKNINDERYLDAMIDGLKSLENDLEQGIECAMELIERMKRSSDKHWKNILRLKQKIILKLAKKDHQPILLAKLIVQ